MKDKRAILQSVQSKASAFWTRLKKGAIRAWKTVSGFFSSKWQAFKASRFADFLKSQLEQFGESRPVKALKSLWSRIFRRTKKETEEGTAGNGIIGKAEAAEDFDSPSTEMIAQELAREKYASRYRKLLRSTVYALIVTAAAAALVATLLLPVLQIYGNSMTPTLVEGDIVVSVKTNTYDYGDICSFYYSNRILVKRVIGKPLDRIDIDQDGNVYVNGKMIDEPYVKEKARGECDIEFPYRVPENCYFMIGDHRATSIDSRSSSVGCISHDEIVGKIIFTVWPIKHFGITK